MSSQVYFDDINTKKTQKMTGDKNSEIEPRNILLSNVVFRTAMEEIKNLGKRSCNEITNIFGDLKYKTLTNKYSKTINNDDSKNNTISVKPYRTISKKKLSKEKNILSK